MEDQQEVQEILSRSYGMDDIDESELDAGEPTVASHLSSAHPRRSSQCLC